MTGYRSMGNISKYEQITNNSWLLSLPFDLAVLSIWANYYFACTTDPGSVPKDYNSIPIAEQHQIKDSKKYRLSRKPRWCRDCMAFKGNSFKIHFKAPRSHHCSYCNRCILKMDHVPIIISI